MQVRFVAACAVAAWSLVALSRPARAQADAVAEALPRGQSRFRVFGGAEGLRNLVVRSVAQDGNGLLWTATDDGVYRLDGDRFSHFSLEDGLRSSKSYVVGVTPDGEACVGSKNGLVCWDGTRFSQDLTRGVPAIAVHAMVSYAGKLWVGTYGGGLYVQSTAGAFIPAPGWPRAKATIRTLWADERGLVVGDDATVALTTGDGVWRTLDDVGLEHERVDGVLRDRQGGLWIRTPSHLWFLPDGAGHVIDLHDGLPSGYDAVDAPASMAIGPRGNVLVATDVGVAVRDGDRWQLIDRSVGLPAAAVRTLLVDHEGTLWIGSKGLLQLRGRGIVEHHDVASGLPGDVVWAFQRDRDGTLWAGTSRCLAHAIAGRWVCLPGTEGRIVRAFSFAPQGGVFLGGAPSDLLYVAPDGHTRSLGDFGHPADHNIYAMGLGPDGDLWLATKFGLYRLPGAIPGPPVRVVIPGLPGDSRFMTIAVADGNLWTASAEGVEVLDHGTWHVFDARAGFRVSLISYVLARADGRLCATYTEALGMSCFRYDAGAVKDFEHIGPAEGLSTGVVYFLGEDRQRRLWAGTGDGIDVFTPHGVDHFDERDGVAGDDSTAMAFLADPDGSLWMGSTGGATHVLAQYYDGPPRAPRTAFLTGTLGDRSIHGALGALETSHDRNALTLEFDSSSLLDANRVEYQIRLSPLETAWRTTHQREASYPALLPGAYRFEVRARIDAGAWGPAAQLGFAVLPAWWQTRWFLALIALAGLAAIAAGVAWRQRAVMRRRLRQIHRQSDASFHAVIDLMPDLISVHRDGALTYLNLASRRMLGVEGEDGARHHVAQIDLRAFVHPDDRPQVDELFRKVRGLERQVATEVVELRMRGADASWRSCEVSAVVVDIGGARTVVASGRDVTERKRMRAKLLVSDRMASLGTLAAGIAHEINNPLAYVAGNLEVLAETLGDGEAPSATACTELRAAVSDARDGAERVRKIVHGLRSFSRSEAEQRAPLALAGVLESAIRLTANEVRHRAQLVRELGPTPLVVADDGQLTQVFINLLVNAAHAIPEGRSDRNFITVRTRSDGDGNAVVEIEDTGKGMTQDVQSRVFDPFFTTKDVGEGTGLGLSICHGIVSGLGGQISIESSLAPGRTVVRVVLPRQRDATAAIPVVASQPAAAPGPRRHRVMLVDDEPRVAQTIERLLRRDYDVTIALCGQDAIDHIHKGVRFDAIVSDVMMPNMTGIELIEELQRVAPDQARRLIFLSGGVFTAQIRERLEAIGAPQLEKPVTARELRAWVVRVTSDASAREL